MNKRTNFWSPEVISFLKRSGRQDLIDSGDALAQRVTALVVTARERLEKYIKERHLYDDLGGTSLLNDPDAIEAIDHFVNDRLRSEISVLENLLDVFDNFDIDELTFSFSKCNV